MYTILFIILSGPSVVWNDGNHQVLAEGDYLGFHDGYVIIQTEDGIRQLKFEPLGNKSKSLVYKEMSNDFLQLKEAAKTHNKKSAEKENEKAEERPVDEEADPIQPNDDGEVSQPIIKNVLEKIIARDELTHEFSTTFEGTQTQRIQQLNEMSKQFPPLVRGKQFAGRLIVSDVRGQGLTAEISGTLQFMGYEYRIRAMSIPVAIRSKELRKGSVLGVVGRLQFTAPRTQGAGKYGNVVVYEMMTGYRQRSLNYAIIRMSLKKR